MYRENIEQYLKKKKIFFSFITFHLMFAREINHF